MISTQADTFFSHLRCPLCQSTYPAQQVQTVCQDESCRSSLLAVYDTPSGIPPEKLLAARTYNMWRYRAMMPVVDPANIVTLGEGFTPLIPFGNLSDQTRDCEVLWKDESGNPTGSFKARGMSAAVSRAKELGIRDIVTPTAGNAGGALAAYCARGGLRAHIFLPRQTPQVFKDECRLFGGEVTEVEGNIADCGQRAHEQAVEQGWFEVSTLKEPYRLEGKKTMGYEIAEQLPWELPDVILYPTGGGTGLLGIWKAFEEMQQLGWIGSQRPRMVAVQSAQCDGVIQAFHQNQPTAEYVDRGFTIANGLRVPKPYADRLILQVLRESQGDAISLNEAEIEAAMREVARAEGMLIAPEGAALWQAFKKLRSENRIQAGEKVLLINTGSGYKYLENINVG